MCAKPSSLRAKPSRGPDVSEAEISAQQPGRHRLTGHEPGDRTKSQRRGLRGSPGFTLLAAALGVMMVAIDGTIVSVANPAIQSNLGASLADIQWVTNGYLLALAITLITIGKVGDRFGHKKVFLTGVAGFAASSAAIGLSGSSR